MKTTVAKLCACGVLAVCILAGALTYASSVMADQQNPTSQATAVSSTRAKQEKHINLALLEMTRNVQPAQQAKATASTPLTDHLLPVALWFLGSAAMAMVGYKRMRY